MASEKPAGDLGRLVALYQSDPRGQAADDLLRYLDPAIRREAGHWRLPTPAVDVDDIRQQLGLYLLMAARRAAPCQPDQWLRRRLFQRARRRLAGWLSREGDQAHELLVEDLTRPPAPGLPGWLRRDVAFDVLFRHHVLGESIREIAAEQGVDYGLMRQRLSRARRRIGKVQKNLREM